MRRLLPALALLALAGCGGAAGVAAVTRPPAPASPGRPAATVRLAPSRQCASAVLTELGQIATNIYAQAAGGRNVESSVKRLARSTRLARAAASGSRAATRRALRPLIKSQIKRIEIVGPTGRPLASYGMTDALAPVPGVLRLDGRSVARYVLSVAGARATEQVMGSITGGRVSTGDDDPPDSVSFGATRYPRGPLRLHLAVPSDDLGTCGTSGAQTRALTIGAVGRRLYAAEGHGSAARRDLRHVVRDARFRAAVADRDPVAIRRAVIRFFRTRWMHVVRIRATDPSGRVIADIGGPDVLAPTSRDVGSVGRVTLAVQDDTGYIKLMHRFTGAAVVLQAGRATVPGSSVVPGLPPVTADGPLVAAGRRYEVDTFAARAFPDTPLRISLLVAA